MGVTLINNQPIIFNGVTTPCRCPEIDFKQPIDHTDVTQFQFTLDPCAGTPQLISNSDFDTSTGWVLVSGWSIADSLATKADGFVGRMNKLNVTVPGSVYQMQINIRRLKGVLQIRTTGGTIYKEIRAAGIHTFNFAADNFHLSFYINETSTFCELDSVVLFLVSPNTAWGIIDANGDTVHVSNYISNPDSFCFSGNKVTVSIDWESLGLDDGCYQIGLTQPCQNECGQNGLPNGDFILGDTYWDETILSGSPVSIFDNSTLFVSGTTNDLVRFVNNNVSVCSGVQYNVTVVLDKVQNASVVVKLGTNFALFNTAGSQTQTITANGTTFSLEVEITSSGGNIRIDSVQIELVDIADYTFTLQSVGVQLGNYLNDCGINEVSICNDDDSWGFSFEGGCFLPSIRIPSQFSTVSYPNEREINDFNNGRRSVQWAESRKIRSFTTEILPEYVYDFLRFMPVADHLYINDIEYFSEDDEISLQPVQDRKNEAQMSINISEIESLFNVNNGLIGNNCNITDTVVTSPAGDTLTESSTGDNVGTKK